MSIYHMINWFFVLSLLGYLLECVALACEDKTPVINGEFGHEPFCIIYGFKALGAVALLTPLTDNPIKLYVASTAMMMMMELVTAFTTVRLLGSFWWDYSKKLLNYREITCLESSLAWGFLGITFSRSLNELVHHLIGYTPENLGKKVVMGLVVFYLVDFTYTMREQMRESEDGGAETMIERLKLY